jgi:NAD(P)-dependent dehydrogenase (short-subunit alcohol dehydrogenase family)
MVKDNFGRIAMVLTSYCIGVPPKYLSEYVSAKYALMGLMKSLAVEYAGKGITINAVAPSMTETKFLSTLPEFEIESTAKAHPMGRIATPEDIVGILGMLLKQDIEYMTGTIIPITGGTAFF